MSTADELKVILDTINQTAAHCDPMDTRKVVIHIHVHVQDMGVPNPDS